MLATFYRIIALGLLLTVAACGTTDSAMQQQGRSESYITGFHDGRHSGLKEAGNNYEHYIKDVKRFESDADYREGWLAGEAEGKQEKGEASGHGSAGSVQLYVTRARGTHATTSHPYTTLLADWLMAAS